jgi:heavy metal-binding protein
LPARGKTGDLNRVSHREEKENRVIRPSPLLLAACLLVIGCAGRLNMAPVPPNHPASPEAREAVSTKPLSSLQPDAQDAWRTASSPGGQHRPEDAAQGAMSHEGHGAEHGSTMRHNEGGTPAQTDKDEGSRPVPPSATQPAVLKHYTCPMHHEILQDKPGKCPKCGMTLVEKVGPR